MRSDCVGRAECDILGDTHIFLSRVFVQHPVLSWHPFIPNI